MSEQRSWLITGGSRGLGRAFVSAALAAGDRVAECARSTSELRELATTADGALIVFDVDVTDRAAVVEFVSRAHDILGRIDVVVNNAGNITMGMVEEFTEAQARAQFETNFFGSLWVSQAVVPFLRAQGSGHIVQISSIGALASAPTTGLYSASKAALEAMSESLAMEVAGFGITLTIVEPGGYWTDLYTTMTSTDSMPVYDRTRHEIAQQWEGGSVDSAPELAAAALLTLVNAENPPRRLLLGGTAFDAAAAIADNRRAEYEKWESVTRAAESAIAQPVRALS
ncbi:SDR family NAD(P)-dependent oxidoreductase [Antrihabitans sp. YC2-6]|uniref:SDR family NAD(P)-dependent oxidoreductase n=1 Tax=Antrihabitans sp. YC2-6 TaxID=2799498 RepID=UPI0018F4881F|nr:SDR family NAD(P)-dependent oxidoreductase [Antrihabitans sp. YC2-6]MBJ8346910.1 SDR family NAD(P)-dependent oxidoreductase [Antrihabitans sp. YC2-6]